MNSSTRTLTHSKTLPHHTARVNALAISPEGDFLLSGGEPILLFSLSRVLFSIRGGCRCRRMVSQPDGKKSSNFYPI